MSKTKTEDKVTLVDPTLVKTKSNFTRNVKDSEEGVITKKVSAEYIKQHVRTPRSEQVIIDRSKIKKKKLKEQEPA